MWASADAGSCHFSPMPRVKEQPRGTTTAPPLRISRLREEVPGGSWIFLGLYLTCLITCRPILYLLGVSLSLRAISQLGDSLAFFLIVVGTYKYIASAMPNALYRGRYRQQVWAWFFFVLFFAVYGFLLQHNEWADVGKEFIGLSYIGVFLLLGGDDRVWYALSKHLTCIFYVGAVLILVFYDTPGVNITSDDTMQYASTFMSNRYLSTIGYNLRPLIGSGVLLGTFGLVRRDRGLWRVLQILALGVTFACEVFLFKFRSGATIILLAGLSILVLRPVYEGRIQLVKTVILLTLGLVGIGYYIKSEASELLRGRFFLETQQEPLFQSRNAELDAYMEQMGWKVLIGNGVGGRFDASSVYKIPSASKWGALHYGVLKFSLIGGLPLLGLFALFVVPGLVPQRRSWYKNPCNMTAALLFPIYFIGLLVGPILVEPEALTTTVPIVILFARFALRRHATGRLRRFSLPEASVARSL